MDCLMDTVEICIELHPEISMKAYRRIFIYYIKSGDFVILATIDLANDLC